jgi:hypothetical protein
MQRLLWQLAQNLRAIYTLIDQLSCLRLDGTLPLDLPDQPINQNAHQNTSDLVIARWNPERIRRLGELLDTYRNSVRNVSSEDLSAETLEQAEEGQASPYGTNLNQSQLPQLLHSPPCPATFWAAWSWGTNSYIGGVDNTEWARTSHKCYTIANVESEDPCRCLSLLKLIVILVLAITGQADRLKETFDSVIESSLFCASVVSLIFHQLSCRCLL